MSSTTSIPMKNDKIAIKSQILCFNAHGKNITLAIRRRATPQDTFTCRRIKYPITIRILPLYRRIDV